MIRKSNVGLDHLRGLFAKQSIATMDQLKKTVGTVADLTVYRKLRELDYCASYSHRGRFYTLRELAEFDENGLWWIRSHRVFNSWDARCLRIPGHRERRFQPKVNIHSKAS